MQSADPIWGSKPRLSVVHDQDTPPLVLRPARLPDPHTIPPRQWLYGTQLLRGFVTVLVAPGGTGKSIYAMTVAVSCVLGRGLLRDHVFACTNAAVLNLEDPLDELDRRLAAILLQHNVDETDVAGGLFMHSGEDRPVTMAAISEDGFSIIHPDEVALIEQIKMHEIGVLVVDPFAESHSLEENSNPQMVKAAAAWRRVARATNCAIFLIHHVRKGAVSDIDAARGAKGLTDSARVGLIMSPMGEDDGKDLAIAPEDRWQYVRLDNAKANMAPRGNKATWLKLEQVKLGNGTQDYPNGDTVAAMVAWDPPKVTDTLSVDQCNEVLDAIADGPGEGVRYTHSRRGKDASRWAGTVLVRLFGLTDLESDKVIETWVRNGVLVRDTYRDPVQRKDRMCVRVVDAKRPGPVS
jgi:hypothetical protein